MFTKRYTLHLNSATSKVMTSNSAHWLRQNRTSNSLRELRLHCIFPLKMGLTDVSTLCKMLYNSYEVHSHFSFFRLLFNAQCSICPRLFRFYYAHLQLYSSFSNYQLNAQFLYSSTTCMLHYDPQHVSSSTLLTLRRTNCITTASGIVTLCKQPYSMPVESGLSPLSTAYCTAVYREWQYQRL